MTRQKIIIDCDPGIDDTLALLYALKHPQLEVVAITIVAGNCPTDLGVKIPLLPLNSSIVLISLFIKEQVPL